MHSCVEIYVHVIWTTEGREPFLTDAVMRPNCRCVGADVQRLKGTVLALNGMPDHLHLLARLWPTTYAATLANRVNGVSSRFANDQLNLDYQFEWRKGYGCFSLSRSHLKRVMAYIRNQQRHHANGTV